MTATPRACNRERVALQAVHFFMADMEAGMGPFLGVLLQSRGWTTGAIGAAMTLGAIVGMVTVAPRVHSSTPPGTSVAASSSSGWPPSPPRR